MKDMAMRKTTANSSHSPSRREMIFMLLWLLCFVVGGTDSTTTTTTTATSTTTKFTQQQRQQQEENHPTLLGYSYLDNLRLGSEVNNENDNHILSQPLVDPNNPNHFGRNLHFVQTRRSSTSSNSGSGDGTSTNILNHTTTNNNNTNLLNETTTTTDATNTLSMKDDDDEMILCHIPIFFRWTNTATNPNDYVDVSNWAYGGSAAAIMAIQDFNTDDTSIVSELENLHDTCPIKFTTELINTESSAINAVRKLTSLLIRDPTSLVQPQPCAIVASSWSSVTKKMATVSGVHDLLQVTSSASSVALDNKVEYPLFARTHPSDAAMAELGVRYFAEYFKTTNTKIQYFGLLYVDNDFGSSYKKDVLDTAAQYNITVVSASFRPDATIDEIRIALQQLQDTTFNYFMAVLFQAQYQPTMELAGEMGLAGPGKFWLLSGALASTFVDDSTTFPTNSFAAKATYGNAIIHDEGGLPGFPQFDKFLRRWKDLGMNDEALSYINSKQPAPPEGTNLTFQRTSDYFQTKPSHIATFSYDAIIGMGLSACRAYKAATQANTLFYDIFTGADHHQQFVNDHPYRGATGDVVIGPETFSRSAESTYFVISNILPIEGGDSDIGDSNNNDVDDEVTVFQGIPKVYYNTDSQSWATYSSATTASTTSTAPMEEEQESERFIYPDGSRVPPKDIPDQVHNQNQVRPFFRILCLFLASFGMILSLAFGIFSILKRNTFVILASQPPFLVMICCGTFLMQSSIIPSSFDDSIASDEGLDIACISSIWLFSVGFVITFSALFSKLWRINKLFASAREFKRAQVNAPDVLIPFLLLLSCNVSILIVWTIQSPIQWERQIMSVDAYDRTTESVGLCISDDWIPYGTSLICINGVAMFLALWQAYKARDINTEFGESKYIAMAMTCIFQATFIGLPLLFLVSQEPTAKLFIVSGVVTIITIAILLLLFVPKLMVMRNSTEVEQRERLAENLRQTVASTRDAPARERKRLIENGVEKSRLNSSKDVGSISEQFGDLR